MSVPSDPHVADLADEFLADRYSPAALLDRLPAHIDFAPHMLTDSDKAAPLWVLGCFPHGETRIWNHVGYAEIGFDRILLEPGWTSAEVALLEATYALTGIDLRIHLDELATRVDDERWNAFLEGLRIRRAGLRGQL